MKMIVCIDDNRAIGKDGGLCYRIVDDMRHFKEITMNKTVVMGRKTYDSLMIKPLPDRNNIVITRDKSSVSLKGSPTVVESADEARTIVFETDCSDTTFIIGGASIYEEFIDDVDQIYITSVKGNIVEDADTFFPEFKDKFEIVSSQPFQKQGDLVYEFEIWNRKVEDDISNKYEGGVNDGIDRDTR